MSDRAEGQGDGRFTIDFATRKFDVTKEPENDINPIRGHSFLAWLRPELEKEGYAVSGPDTEDWGWYLEVERSGSRSMVGAIAWLDDDGCHDWRLQVHRWRTLAQWIRRAPRMRRDDPLLAVLETLLATDEFEDVDLREGERRPFFPSLFSGRPKNP